MYQKNKPSITNGGKMKNSSLLWLHGNVTELCLITITMWLCGSCVGVWLCLTFHSPFSLLLLTIFLKPWSLKQSKFYGRFDTLIKFDNLKKLNKKNTGVICTLERRFMPDELVKVHIFFSLWSFFFFLHNQRFNILIS